MQSEAQTLCVNLMIRGIWVCRVVKKTTEWTETVIAKFLLGE
jgi:hypothetical protein